MNTLSSFKNIHSGETIVVCGCGESLNLLYHSERLITVGVNDVGRRFHPDYLVVVNPRHQFSADRFSYVKNSKARYIFSQYHDLPVPHEKLIQFRLGTYGGVDFGNPDVLHHTQNSPYVAVCLAVLMGAKKVGLIGVDFTDRHFFADTGRHPLSTRLAQIDREYAALAQACRAMGVELVNLSPVSRLTSLPKAELSSITPRIAHTSAPASAELRIVSYSTTPVAGVPPILARCISAVTPHTARCVWATDGYGNGVRFSGDVQWENTPAEAMKLLESADLIIVHNGKVDPTHQSILDRKPVVTMAHNYGWNVDMRFVAMGKPGVVVGQYQATLPEFAGWAVVSNPIPLWEPEYNPGEKGDVVTVAFTPSGRHESYPHDHKLYWHGKGFVTTMRILESLSRRRELRIESTSRGQVSHAEALAMKRCAHIVIDECVTGSYHRNSLEGLATGCLVVNGIGIAPGVREVMTQCAGDCPEWLFSVATLETLGQKLDQLVALPLEELRSEGERRRKWMESYWRFDLQWERQWMPVIDRALNGVQYGRGMVSMSQGAELLDLTTRVPEAFLDMGSLVHETCDPPSESTGRLPGVSVVLPYGGPERIKALSCSLANLAQCEGIDEIIVVELGEKCHARTACARWGARYIFIPSQGPFNRARALNTGTVVATHQLVLWKDVDLLLPPHFAKRAREEMESRGVDFLVPYHQVHCLAEGDTDEVLRGTRSPASCKVVDVWRGGHSNGGAGMVSATFFDRFGGGDETFIGWGYEDWAWWHKAQLLGRTGVSSDVAQILYHLHHDRSHISANNKSVYDAIKGCGSKEQFLARYPPPDVASCPWPRDRVIHLVAVEPDRYEKAHSIATHLGATYGIKCVAMRIDLDDAITLEHGAWDAVVVFGERSAAALAWLERSNVTHPVIVVVQKDELVTTGNSGGSVSHGESTGRASVLRWTAPESWESTPLPRHAALAIVDVLSVVLGNPQEAVLTTPASLPVWSYWEGQCPTWIMACLSTFLKQAPNVRILDAASFDALREHDRDIDLQRLQIPHRADYIRAYLLAHFGGLWVDADCLLMRSPQEIFNRLLMGDDFVAHRERQGFFSNGFMAARLGSTIAVTLYQRICTLLRGGGALEWSSLGGRPLTDILRRTGARWHEVECRLVQPVCWSRPHEFFERSARAVHERNYQADAMCFMLSNTEVRKYVSAHPDESLLADNTFFRFLLDKSLGEPCHSRQPSLPPLRAVPFALQILEALAPSSVLQIGLDTILWSALIREWWRESAGLSKADPVRHLEGIHLPDGKETECGLDVFDRLHDTAEVIPSSPVHSRWSLIVVTEAVAQSRNLELLLQKGMDAADYVFLPNGSDRIDGRLMTAQANVVWEGEGLATSAATSLLLSATDPLGLYRPSLVREVFERNYAAYLASGQESLSGPGSSLAQTAELRQCLPFLLQHIGASTLLDAPCGDFNWMQHVNLGVDRYVGVDIIPDLIERHRRIFGSASRAFHVRDIMRDRLPKCDAILCRDCLVHFSFKDIERILSNFRRSGSRFLLATTFSSVTTNTDIDMGAWRPLNLERAPFHFSKPIALINEKCTEGGGCYRDKSLGLWSL